MMNDVNWRHSAEAGDGDHSRDADENVLLRELVEQMVLPDTSALPTPNRTPRIIALVAATAIVSVAASVFAVQYLSDRSGGAAAPGTERASAPAEAIRTASATPQFLVSQPAGPLDADEAVPLGVSIYGTPEGAEFVISGMAPGSTFSTGRSVGADAWSIPATEVRNAIIAPPRGFVGPMDLSFELRLANGSVVDRKASRLEWSGPVQTAQPARSPAAVPAVATAAAAPSGGTGGIAVHGVTDHEVRFGIAAPFSGPAKELGRQMKLGLDTAFNLTNDSGGVYGRQLKLVAADDGYEPARTAEAVRQLYDKDQVFGMVGNVGTPTAAVALPYALEHKMLFFGAFTGASLLRRDPPDRYVFNYRASYAEETDAVVHYLVKVRRVRPEEIAVFAQQDSYGDAGFAGVTKAMRSLRADAAATLRLNYKRNSMDVQEALAGLRAHRGPIKAVVMVATYRAAAKFIEKARDVFPGMIFTNVSFVGSTALADELMLLGPRYTAGVIVTQVVPAVNSYSTAILEYKSALSKYFPGEAPDYVSLEGYVAGSVLAQALKRAGPQLDSERVVEGFEGLRNLDMGLGTLLTFGRGDHQGSHKVWGTQLDESGQYHPIELQ
ncbi:MAG: ABC transporter substrate-binding protein [Xanthobacteraceae bacterium]